MVDIDGQDCESIIRDFSKGALVWYNFRQDSRILYIYSRQSDEAVLELLESKGKVDDCSVEQLLNNQIVGNAYDYIVGIDVIEESRYPQKLLNICHGLLKPEGRLVIGTENRYAIKYICGDRDPYTNHSFDGMENYRRLSDADRNLIAGRCYSMSELKLMLSLCRKHSLYMQKGMNQLKNWLCGIFLFITIRIVCFLKSSTYILI